MLACSLLLLSSCAPTNNQDSDTSADTTVDTIAETKAEKSPANDTQPTETTAETQEESETQVTVEISDGSFATDGYTVQAVDGVYYLNFVDGNEPNAQEAIYQISDAGIALETLSELRSKLKNNTFTDMERATMKDSFSKNENGIKVFNVNQMYQPICPTDINEAYVYWTGETYGCYVTAPQENVYDSVLNGWIKFLPRKQYEGQVDRNITNYFSNILYEKIVSQETSTWDGMPCEVYVYETSVARLKSVFIELPVNQDGQVRYISIRYRLSHTNPNLASTISETLPRSVIMFGEKDGQGFEINLSNFTTPPTLSFLTSFGITPYVENTESPIPLDTVAQEVEVK